MKPSPLTIFVLLHVVNPVCFNYVRKNPDMKFHFVVYLKNTQKPLVRAVFNSFKVVPLSTLLITDMAFFLFVLSLSKFIRLFDLIQTVLCITYQTVVL